MAATFTTYFNLAKPATGDLDWGPEVDGNFDVIALAMRANQEDRFLRIMGGGTMLYTASTGEISFSEDIVIHHGVTGFVSTIPTSESPLVVSAAFRQVYINITRNPLADEVISFANGNLFNNQTATPATNNAFLFAIRDNVTPVNRVVLPNGMILEDGIPGPYNTGSAVTLQRAYDNSLDGVIEVDPAKSVLIRAADVDTDTPVQASPGFDGNVDSSQYPTPTFFAVRFVLGAAKLISRVGMRLMQANAPAGQWRYKIVGNSSGLPNSADIKWTGAYANITDLPIVPATQYIAGSPSLVSLSAGTYWLVLEVDATYQAAATGSNYLGVARGTGGSPPSATFDGVTTLWSASANNYFNEVYSTALGSGAELLELDSTGEGSATVSAKLTTGKGAQHNLSSTALKGLAIDSFTAPDTIILDTVEDMLTVSTGDDLYLSGSTLPRSGLYKIATITVNAPTGKTTVTIDQSSGIEANGYIIDNLPTDGGPISAVADILRATDKNRLFAILDEALTAQIQADVYGRRLVTKYDMLFLDQARLDLISTMAESGSRVFNVQRQLNVFSSFTGAPLNADFDYIPQWVDASVGSSTDTLFDRTEDLTAEFNPTTGHEHDGVDAPKVQSVNVDTVQLTGRFKRGTDLIAVTGTTLDVSAQLVGAVPSTGDTDKGIVVIAPNNKVILRDAATGDEIVSGAGDQVYGRITEAASVWTLSFYTDIAGVETAFAMSADDLQWYYQQLFNPITDAPVYSELASVPSDNATQDVVDATATQRGLMAASGTQQIGGKKEFVDTTESTTKDTGAIITEGGLGVEKNINAGGSIAAGGTVTGSNLSGSNTGDVTLAAIGSTPNAQGASLTGQVLTLQPASGSFGGVVTTLAQSFAGLKTWLAGQLFATWIALTRSDTASAATIVQLSSASSFQKITGATATAIQGVAAPTEARVVTIHNGTSAVVTLKHQDLAATAADRLNLPEGADLEIPASSSTSLIYDLAQSRWVIQSGAGANSFNYRYNRYVDPVNGSDVTGKGTFSKPWATVTYAMTQITDADVSNVYALHLAPGTYAEGGATSIVWKPFINLIGPAMTVAPRGLSSNFDAMAQFSGITFTLFPSGTKRWYISGCSFDNITTTSGSTMDLVIDSCVFLQNADFGIRLTFLVIRNTVFLGGDIFFKCNSGNPLVVIFDNVYALFSNITKTFLNNLDFTAYDSVFNGGFFFTGSNNIARFYGCEGPVAFTNSATLLHNTIVTDGAFFSEPLGGVPTAFSPNTSGRFTVVHKGGGDTLIRVTGDTVLDGSANTILVDATAAPVSITLPRSQDYRGKSITVVKIDTSSNAVSVLANVVDTLNSGTDPVVLSKKQQSGIFVPDGDNIDWEQVGTGVGSGGMPFRYIRYVDPVNGDDANDGITGPFLTIAAANASITDNDASNVYVIKLAPGTYAESVVLKPFVYVEGEVEEFNDQIDASEVASVTITGDVTFTISGTQQHFALANAYVQGDFNKGTNSSVTTVHIYNCRIDGSVTCGGGDIRSNLRNVYVGSALNFGGGSSASGSLPLARLDNVQVWAQTTITASSARGFHLEARACRFEGGILSNNTGTGFNPSTFRFAGCQFPDGSGFTNNSTGQAAVYSDTFLPLVNASTGRIQMFHQSGDNVLTATATLTLLGNNNIILVNATLGNVTVNLPRRDAFSGKLLQIHRIDTTANTVSVVPSTVAPDTIEAALTSVSLIPSRPSITLAPDDVTSTVWRWLNRERVRSRVKWTLASAAPLEGILFDSIAVFVFDPSLGQTIWGLIKIPDNYVTGSQLQLTVPFISADTVGTIGYSAQVYYAATNIDAATPTQTFTATKVLGAGTVNVPQVTTVNLTDASGQVNGTPIVAGKFLRVALSRVDTVASSQDMNIPSDPAHSEVTYG